MQAMLIAMIALLIGWQYSNFFLIIAGTLVLINEITSATDTEDDE
jgi:hydrogenase-4 membrane subunit HyfE